MKTRNLIFIVICMLWVPATIFSQEYKVLPDNAREGKLKLSGFSGDLIIEGYSGSEIVFSSADFTQEVPERAKGLKPVYAGGTDNTGLGLMVDKNGSEINVQCLLPFTNGADYTVKVPENLSVHIQSECTGSGDITIKKSKGEIEISSCHDIILEEVTGGIGCNRQSGRVDAHSCCCLSQLV